MDNNGDHLPGLGQDDPVKGPVDLNISDILDAICITDPAFDARAVTAPAPAPAPASAPAPAMPPASAPTKATVRIVEQPASKALRFRYECEGRSAGSIPGVNSTSERKTYPTIEISGCVGPAIIVVSCVTKEGPPYKPHPHNLVGRERCERGVCTVRAEVGAGPGGATQVAFSNLGIQCVKRKDIDQALRTREDLRVDPFKTGFTHRSSPQNIDLNAVRLCFQVFITDEKGAVKQVLSPAVSDVIYDKKAMSDLHIARISHCSGPVRGRMTMILLCEKVSRDDTAVVFFEKQEESVVWEALATNVHVHKQSAIAFDTPPYRDQDVTTNVKVYLQLKRTTDNARSNALDFEYTVPPDIVKIKRKKAVSPFAQNNPFSIEPGPSIKAEPKDSPNYVRSPQQGFMTYDNDPMQRWMDLPQAMVGPNQVMYQQNMSWMEQNYLQPNQHMQSSPNMQPVSPHMSHMSPLSPQHAQMAMGHQSPMGHQAPMGHMSPNMGQPSPMGHVSPNMGHPSPMGHVSPNMCHPSNMGHVSPGMGHVSPGMGHVSPGMGHVSPGMGHVSPGLGHQQPQYVQNIGQQSLIQDLDMTNNSNPSISKLLGLQSQGEEMRISSDLSLPMCADLSDSLRDLSTKDLINNAEWPPHGGG